MTTNDTQRQRCTSNVTWRPDVLAKTCELLRSGEIKQARGAMFMNGDGEQCDMCCLGVTTYATACLGLIEFSIDRSGCQEAVSYKVNDILDDTGLLRDDVAQVLTTSEDSAIHDHVDPPIMIDVRYLTAISHGGPVIPTGMAMIEVSPAQLNDTYLVSFADIADIFEEAFS